MGFGMNYEEYKNWLGDRNDTMAARKEYNYVVDGPVVGFAGEGIRGSRTGKVYENPYPYDPDRPYNYAKDPYDLAGNGDYENGSPLAQAYAAQREAQRAQIQAQVDQAVGRLNAQKDTVNQQFTDAARQAYIQKMNSQKNLGQQMAASGLSGGLTESSRLALESGYGNNLTSLTQSRDNALNEIENSINDVKASGDISIAEMENQFALQQAQEAAAALERQRELADQKALMEYEYQLKNQYGSTGGSSGISTYKPKLTYDQVKELWDEGYDTSEVAEALEYYTGTVPLSVNGSIFEKELDDRLNENTDLYAMQGQAGAVSRLNGIAYALQSNLDSGFITERDVRILAQKYGINLK